MVELDDPALDAVFHALADPTRRRMLRALSEGEQSISALAAPFAMTLAGASKHLKVCEEAGLVQRTVRGRTHFCSLRPEVLAGATDWLRYYERFWQERFDALDAVLAKRQRSRRHPDGGGRR